MPAEGGDLPEPPWVAPEEHAAFRAFWTVYEAEHAGIAALLATEPELAPTYLAAARREARLHGDPAAIHLVRTAVDSGDWTAVAAAFARRGLLLAELDVDLDEWSDVALRAAYHLTSRIAVALPDGHAAAIGAMYEFLRHGFRTARRHYRLARGRNDARFSRLGASGIVGIAITGHERRILEANDTFLAMLGYTREDLESGQMRWDDLTPPEWMEVSNQIVDEVTRTGAARPREKAYRHKNGTLVPVLIGIASLAPPQSIIFVLDITEQRRTEDALRRGDRLFRAMVETSPDAISLLAADGTFIYASPVAARIAGRKPDELIGTPVFDLIAADALPEYRKNWQACLDQPWVRLHDEFSMRLPDGNLRHAESRRANYLEDPSIGAVVSFVRDTTDKRRLEEQLRQAQKMEAVGTLAGGIAHDFNNLLSVILGYCDVLEFDRVAPTSRDEIGEIRHAAERAASLTKQLLAFSRKQILAPRVINLSTTVREMDKLLRRLIGENIEIITLAADGLGNVRIDPNQIEQVLMNLAVNARDAMPSGGKLVIETRDFMLEPTQAEQLGIAPGPHVLLAVTDSGIGMDPETVARVFEPFFSTKRDRGTGLGLATVFGIIRQSGGAISVYSEPGTGTTFKIYLPRTSDHVPHAHAPLSPTTVGGNETILLVEDEAQVRQLVKELLLRQGYSVLEAGRPDVALQLATEHRGPIHLLLTDVMMPVMTGRELADRLAPDRPTTRVLFMSGYTDQSVVHNGILELGIAFLPKPITRGELLRMVRETIDAPRT